MQKLSKETAAAANRPIKVIQFGEGNFLRAFVDWMVQKLNDETDFNGNVALVQPIAQGMVEMLREQDFLFTHYLKGIKGKEAVREHLLNNSIGMGVNPYEDYEGFLDLAAIETARFIISNTTEAGITYVAGETLEGPQKGFPAKLAALLYKRYQVAGGDVEKGFHIIPCELIDRNGDKLKELVLRHSGEWQLEAGFTAWLEEANVFYNSLVDRIVPGFPRETIKEIQEELGYEDNLVVESEQFNLWVIEGPESLKEDFPIGKTSCNVLVVEDMTPYRTRKVRILNGAHTSMVPVAYLYGIETVRETVEHEVLGDFVKKAIFEEIIPTLDLPKEELEAFAFEVIDRFRNPFVVHKLMSISLNSMSKFKTRVLPSLSGYLEKTGELPKLLVFSLAALIRFYKGERDGEAIALSDDADILAMAEEAWAGCDGSKECLGKAVSAFLGYETLWAADLNTLPGLHDAVAADLALIVEKGMKKALEEVL